MTNHRAHRPCPALLALLLLAGCAVESETTSSAPDVRPVPMTSTTPTESAGEPTAESTALPPLDQRAPAHLETATFALG